MEILTVENLSFAYSGCSENAIDNISFSLKKGDFVTLCGATGSGKSTLLRLLKQEIAPLGKKSGKILFQGIPLQSLDGHTSAQSIGFVSQHPEHQIVTDKVWHELAFGLENLKFAPNIIRRRVAEVSSYFGIEDLFEKNVSELSGGQMQIINLASVMVMNPLLIVLDEPTAQLDPVTAADFIATLVRLNRELSLTILASEHRLEDILPASNKLMAMEEGRIIEFGNVRSSAEKLCVNNALPEDIPAAVRIYSRFKIKSPCPLTISEGRKFIENNFKNSSPSIKEDKHESKKTPALEFSNVYFGYSKEAPDVLKNLKLTVYSGEIFCIMGGNGSGKTTALETAAGLNHPHSGKIKVFGKKLKDYKNGSLYQNCLALLPQDVQTAFLKNTVREELAGANYDEEIFTYNIELIADKHPYDLSGGEQQIVAIAKVLSSNPRLLLLDEPTKGLDSRAKEMISEVLGKLKNSGVAVVVVTHDVEFAALCADRCALFFRGEIVSINTPRQFFSENSFYTTSASRMTRGYYDNAITIDDVEKLCLINGRKDAKL